MALFPGPRHACLDPLSENLTLQLGVGHGDIVEGFPEGRCSVQAGLAVAPEAHSPGAESLQGGGGIKDGAEGSVYAPDQQQVKLLAASVFQKLSPGSTVKEVGGWGVVYVFPMAFPPLGSYELPQWDQLGLRVLLLVRGGYSGIQSYLHGLASNRSSTWATYALSLMKARRWRGFSVQRAIMKAFPERRPLASRTSMSVPQTGHFKAYSIDIYTPLPSNMPCIPGTMPYPDYWGSLLAGP